MQEAREAPPGLLTDIPQKPQLVSRRGEPAVKNGFPESGMTLRLALRNLQHGRAKSALGANKLPLVFFSVGTSRLGLKGSPATRGDMMIDISRRMLLVGAAVSAIGSPALARELQRNRFNLGPDTLYLNAANIGAGFRSAIKAEHAAAAGEVADPSFEYRARFNDIAEALRARIARQINAPVEGIALTRNCSEGNTVIVRGVPLKAGDEVVIGRENHASNERGWKRRAAREGIVVKVAQHSSLPVSPSEVVQAFAAAITSRTRVVSISHVSNVAGLIMPVAEIAKLTHDVGAWLHLDCAQSYGWIQLDVAALGCDSLAASSQKWLMGPIGGGLLYVRPARIGEIDPPIISSSYWESGPSEAMNGQIFERFGQSDDAKLLNYAATLDEREQIGEATIERMVVDRAQGLRRRLAAKGVQVAGSGDPSLWGPILAAVISGDVSARRKALWKDHRLSCGPASAGGVPALRLSPHIYTSDADLDRVATLLA